MLNLLRQSEIGFRHNPVGVGFHGRTVTQGSSFLATLGFGTESRWDSWRGEFELRFVGWDGMNLPTISSIKLVGRLKLDGERFPTQSSAKDSV